MPKQTKEPEVFPHDHDTAPISVGSAWLNHNARSAGGATCPCCAVTSKFRGYSITSKFARLLIVMYRSYPPGTQVNVPPFNGLVTKGDLISGHEWGALHYWGLLKVLGSGSPTASKSGDTCELTQKGQDFVYRSLRIPKKIWIANNAIVAVEPATVTIQEALGKKHDYTHLMTETYNQPGA
jgi:hypothetical protein